MYSLEVANKKNVA